MSDHQPPSAENKAAATPPPAPQPIPRDELVAQLIQLLRTGGAHPPISDVFRDLPAAAQGVRPADLPFSCWELLEHLRIAQQDILRFSQGPSAPSLTWPEDYWPATPAPPTPDAWDDSLAQLAADRTAFESLLLDPARDLTTPFPWGDGQTLLREALLIADHNAWHAGQVVLIRRLLGVWTPWQPPSQPPDASANDR